jgi:hypothetical protein
VAEKPKPKPKLQQGRRISQRAETDAEMAELRSRVASQADEIEELRREVGWLSEELIADEAGDGIFADGAAGRGHLTRHVRRVVHECVPRGSSLGVVSSGDESLLRFVGCKAVHLSQDSDGLFTAHPDGARAAVVQLEAARWGGADFLVIPENGLWYFEHYEEFGKHLSRLYTSTHEDDVTSIWDLRSPGPLREVDEMLAGLSVQPGHQPVVLDWHTGQDLAGSFPDHKVFSPIEDLPRLPYLDHSVEVVVIPEKHKKKRTSEARRVASHLVIAVGSDSRPSMDILWRSRRLGVCQKDVSVIAVSRDRRPLSFEYVRRLLDSLPISFDGELVVCMDRGAVPQLGPDAARLKRIKLIPFQEDDRFAARVRRAAEAAKGETLVVLDGSTRPVVGWLPPLVRLLEESPGVGAATGMLVQPDGRPLQSPPPRKPDGGAAPTHDLDAAHRRYVRPTKLVSGSFFATRRELLLELDQGVGGLEEALAEHLRAKGLSTLYQPETLAISEWSTLRMHATEAVDD